MLSKESSDVYLRALEVEDSERTYQWRYQQDVIDSIIGFPYYVSKDSERRWIETISKDFSLSQVKLAICTKESGDHIGNVYLTHIDHLNKNSRIGILIGDDKNKGKGFGIQAYNLMLAYGFLTLGLVRITAYVLEGNVVSQKLHSRCGFVKEGLLRNAVFKNGKYANVIAYSILREEFAKLNPEQFNS